MDLCGCISCIFPMAHGLANNITANKNIFSGLAIYFFACFNGEEISISKRRFSLALKWHSGSLSEARVERYDLVKIKPKESEGEHCFCLKLSRLWSKENYIAGVRSSNERINQSKCFISPGFVIAWFFRLCFRLQQSSFHLIISDGIRVVNGIERDGTFWFFLLRFRHPHDSDFRFSLAFSRLWLRFRLWS